MEKELITLLNTHSTDNECNTPDFILAKYLIGCLNNYKEATNKNIEWHKEGTTKDYQIIGDLQFKIENLKKLLYATVWHLNNPKGTRMSIHNDVFRVVDKKIAQLPENGFITESEALKIVRKT